MTDHGRGFERLDLRICDHRARYKQHGAPLGPQMPVRQPGIAETPEIES